MREGGEYLFPPTERGREGGFGVCVLLLDRPVADYAPAAAAASINSPSCGSERRSAALRANRWQLLSVSLCWGPWRADCELRPTSNSQSRMREQG